MGARLSSILFAISSNQNQLHNPCSENGSVSVGKRGNGIINNDRTYQTAADFHFQEHRTLIPPPIPHAVLMLVDNNRPSLVDGRSDITFPDLNQLGQPHKRSSKKAQGIFIIGDVHGCYDELILLLQKAQKEYNNNIPFALVIFVGDLCNKGPYSVKVIKFIREKHNENKRSLGNDGESIDEDNCTYFYAVRGNHDNATLQMALSGNLKNDDQSMSPSRRQKYAWIWGDAMNSDEDDTIDDNTEFLSDGDIVWMSELPYTITIPASILDYYDESNNENKYITGRKSKSVDTVIVHAGFIPNVPILDQTVETMVTVREVEVDMKSKVNTAKEKDIQQTELSISEHDSQSKHIPSKSTEGTMRKPWASQWKGPPRVIFGHDAKRGIQRYPTYSKSFRKNDTEGNANNRVERETEEDDEEWAIGLDSGACYGGSLTGIILPQRELVSVKSLQIYCPISKKD